MFLNSDNGVLVYTRRPALTRKWTCQSMNVITSEAQRVDRSHLLLVQGTWDASLWLCFPTPLVLASSAACQCHFVVYCHMYVLCHNIIARYSLYKSCDACAARSVLRAHQLFVWGSPQSSHQMCGGIRFVCIHVYTPWLIYVLYLTKTFCSWNIIPLWVLHLFCCWMIKAHQWLVEPIVMTCYQHVMHNLLHQSPHTLLVVQCVCILHRLNLSEMALHQTGRQNLLYQEVLRSRGVVPCTAAEELLPHIASLVEEGKPWTRYPCLCVTGNEIVFTTGTFTVTDGQLQKELSDSPEISSDAVISAIGLLPRSSFVPRSSFIP